MTFLGEHYLPDLEANIVTERYIDPLYFQNELGHYKGAAFSLAPSFRQTGHFRPKNKSEDIDKLYFVGAGTHPGAGLPSVLLSGKIVAGLIGEA